ncbi:MAG TPA: prolyl oligopeptidase family serine peptidase [Vicinamibacterales bacterium]|nr:prolyl oligopeptidase family serine peptidase [Vicinamibacterales bacterium]
MHHHATMPLRRTWVGFALAAAFLSAYALPSAQQASPKKVLSVEDYSKWRTISGQEISGDGNWLTYTQSLTNTIAAESKPVLHVVRLETNQHVEVPNATGGIFSADSKWIAYQVDPSGGRGGRGSRGGANAPAIEPSPGGDTAVPPSAPGVAPPSNPAQTTTPPGQNPPTTPTQPQPNPPTPPAPTTTAPAPAPATSPAPAQGTGRGAAANAPTPPTRVELRNLATGTIKSWQDIQSFAFSANSTHLVLKRKAPGAAGAATGRGGASGEAPAPGGGAPAAAVGANAPQGPRGTDVIIHNLVTGRDQLLGSVNEIAFNKPGELLAYTIDAAVKDGNGLFVIDLKTNRFNTLDNDAKIYSRLTWSDDGTALAVLKGSEVEKMRERDNVLIAFPNVQSALSDLEASPATLDPAKAASFPKGWVVSDRGALDWSDDNKRVFFGAKAQVPAPDSGPRKGIEELANVDVWNTADERVQSLQMNRAEQDRNFTFRQVFDVSAAKYVKLADETMRELDVAPDGRWAAGRDTRGFVHDFKRASADIYRVNTSTGERTLMLKAQLTNTSTGSHTFGISPDGHYFLYWKDSRLQAYDLDAASSRTLGGTAAPSFIDIEFDHPGPKPAYGIAGYTTDKKSVIVQHRYDLWEMPLDGSAARNLTNGVGTKGEIRFRYVRTEPLEPNLGSLTAPTGGQGGPGGGGFGGGRGGSAAARATIDLSKPIMLSAYGEYTKKAGFYELANGQLKELVYEDAAFSNPVKAAKADKYLFTRQTFVEFPDLRVSNAGFKDSTKISDANPQQKEYMWGHRILFDFKNKDGVRLQGILALPDDYKPGEKRPMLVTFYEKNSQNLHRYNAPSYLTGMGGSPMEAVSKGYITMLPDVYFRTGASHSDMLECVEAATRKVIEMGYADPKHIGITGHSYGGEGAAFIGTRSRLFAAVGMGAGVTDLYFDFNQNWGWSYAVQGGSGANAFDYYLYSQGREAVSPWEKPEMYMFESALTHVPEVTAPFLIMHGAADPTVPFTNGLAMYNALRYNNKKAVLLAYPGEGHGLRGVANRKDLTVRFFEFFDHYLKGAPAPKWLTEGITFLDKEKPTVSGSGASH